MKIPFLHGALILCCLASWAAADDASVRSSRTDGEVLFAVPDIYSVDQAMPIVDATVQARAEAVFAQAQEYAESGDVGSALRLAARTLMFNPDHEAARRVMGYQRYDKVWAGGYAIRQLKRGLTWDHQFGWVAPDDVSHYERGERPLGNRWISADEAAARHDSVDDGWHVRTDHFLVTSNHSLTAAVELAARLEELYQLWLQQCGAFFLDADEIQRRFAGRSASSYRRKPFQVIYHRNRDEYNEALIRQQPRIGITLGIYFDTTRESHFFAGPDQDVGTLNHEAVHQFFQESTHAARSVGGLGNAWVIEGIACYFESLMPIQLSDHLRAFTIGTPQAGRLPAARQRCLQDNYYMPLEELSRLGTNDLQRRRDIARLYSQAAGLATFFMHYQNGIYRSALLQFLQLVYTGRDKPDTLPKLTGNSYNELDGQYREYLQRGTDRVSE